MEKEQGGGLGDVIGFPQLGRRSSGTINAAVEQEIKEIPPRSFHQK
jgi:hypothetical protein